MLLREEGDGVRSGERGTVNPHEARSALVFTRCCVERGRDGDEVHLVVKRIVPEYAAEFEKIEADVDILTTKLQVERHEHEVTRNRVRIVELERNELRTRVTELEAIADQRLDRLIYHDILPEGARSTSVAEKYVIQPFTEDGVVRMLALPGRGETGALTTKLEDAARYSLSDARREAGRIIYVSGHGCSVAEVSFPDGTVRKMSWDEVAEILGPEHQGTPLRRQR